MPKCEYCEISEHKQGIILEHDGIIIAARDHILGPGQISVFPKEHFTIMEMVPEDILERCASVANKVSIATFESLGSQGTNLIVKNGVGAAQTVPHFAIDIVPRKENDGLNFQWDAKQLAEDVMETAFTSITEQTKQVGKEEKEETVDKIDDKGEKKDNYLLKSLRRVP